MNKFEKFSIATISALAIFGSTVFASTGTIENTSEGLVFRKKASKSSDPISTLYNGTVVEIIEKDGDWYKVKYDGKEGYLFAEYVKVSEEEKEDETQVAEEDNTENQTANEENISENKTEQEENKTYPINEKVSKNAKVYILPSITSTAVATIKKDETVTVEKELNNWAYVTSGNTKGWIRIYNLSDSESEKTEETKTEEESEKEEEKTPSITSGYVNEASVNLRKEASLSSKVLTTLVLNTKVEITAETDEWYKVKYESYEGYIAKRLISEKATATSRSSGETRQSNTWTGYISVGIANVREKASTDSQIITTLKQKTAIEVTGEKDDFYKITLNGETAYVSKTLVVDSLDKIVEAKETSSSSTKTETTTTTSNKETSETTTTSKTESSTATTTTTKTEETVTTSSSTSDGEKIVAFAKKYLNYKYVYGGTTPSGGFDCSGFVYYVFNNCGYSLSRSCSVQAKSGTAVSKANLMPGDIIFFNNTSDGSIGHVGIYIGDGKFIHAANSTRGVVIDTINSGYYYTYYYSARRIVK